ncbi:MAG: P-loop NTPase [Phycisphaerales bacterium JB039]
MMPAVPSIDQASRLRDLVSAGDEAVARRSAAPVVAIASGKGGVGKTTCAVNLSIALAQMGLQVTLVDADLGMANADVICGASPRWRLQHVASGDPHDARSAAERMRRIAIDAPGGFRLVPGAVGVARLAALTPADRDALLAGLAGLDRVSDIVLVDTGAGLGPAVLTMMGAADYGLIVCTTEPAAIADAYALIKTLVTERTMPMAGLGLVVNQVARQSGAEATHRRIAAVCGRFLDYPLPLVGWVRDDERMRTAVRRRRPLLLDTPRSRAARDLGRLARRVREQAGQRPAATSTGLAGRLGRPERRHMAPIVRTGSTGAPLASIR